VGSLWEVRDEETAALMRLFYGELAEGNSPSSALAQAKRELSRRGVPASAWAGFVALGAAGDPLWAPSRSRQGIAIIVAVAIEAALAGLLIRRARS